MQDMQDMQGMIFNIQKFSLHDGPGIRTVVFLKGCPMHCPWCSNPESISSEIQITWKQLTCSHCNTCIDACPQKAISRTNDKITINEDLCNQCLICTQICPTSSLSYEGWISNVMEIMDVVKKDIPFYEESNGGLTLSGGEILQQADFAIELLKAAKALHIHTAAETTCYTDSTTFEKFIEHLDLLLCDIKHYDTEKHEQTIGVPLNIIHNNIKHAIREGKKVIARIPVIPDFNYSLEDAENFCQLLNSLNIHHVTLLPYHNYGENKYTLLNRPYKMSEYSSIDKSSAYFMEYMNVFRKHNFNIIN